MHRTSRTAGFVLAACIASVVPAHTLRAADADPAAADQHGRVALTGWVSEDAQYSNPVETETADEGRQLVISFRGGAKDKAVVWKSLDDAKMTATGTLNFLVANLTTGAVQVSVALKTGPNYTFHESKQVTVKPDTNTFQRVAVDLGSSTFKSAATAWKHTGTLADPDALRSIQVLVYNGSVTGEVIVADIRIAPKP